MKRTETKHHSSARIRRGIQVLAVSALLCALSIVFGKYLAISVGPVLRFSFENLPILMGGVLFGPLAGLFVGVVADLVGCVLVGYTINPIITLGAACIGFFGGLLYRLFSRVPLFPRLLLSVIISHVIGSVLIKTWGLAAFYDMPFYLLLLWRLLNYTVVGGAECALFYYLMKHKAVSRQLERLQR
ncbi:MAG: folate family ECF transporter S component [Ruminococcaceae bacterium]|nr:folate family ECF transporter S component [Oscillospiraceae bacterium]